MQMRQRFNKVCTLLLLVSSSGCKTVRTSNVAGTSANEISPTYDVLYRRNFDFPVHLLSLVPPQVNAPEDEEFAQKLQTMVDKIYPILREKVKSQIKFPAPKVIIDRKKPFNAQMRDVRAQIPLAIEFENPPSATLKRGKTVSLGTWEVDDEETESIELILSPSQKREIMDWLIRSHRECLTVLGSGLRLTKQCLEGKKKAATYSGAEALMLKFPTNEILMSHDYKKLDDRTMGFMLAHELGHFIQRHHFPAEERMAISYPYEANERAFNRITPPVGLSFGNEKLINLYNSWEACEDKDCPTILNKLMEQKIYRYSKECEADDFALIFAVSQGMSRELASSWPLQFVRYIQSETNGKWPPKTRGVPDKPTISECQADLSSGFKNGAPPFGGPNDAHNEPCFRAYRFFQVFPSFQKAYGSNPK